MKVLSIILVVLIFISGLVYAGIKIRKHILKLHNEAPVEADDIVLVGDSITYGFQPDDLFKYHIKNKGIPYNTSQDVVRRFKDIILAKPKRIFLMVGVNDVLRGMSLNEYMANVSKLLQWRDSLSPHTQIFIESILPTTGNYIKYNTNIDFFNMNLRQLCNSHDVEYIDVHSLFSYNAGMKPEYTTDGIHLTKEAYKVLQEKLSPMWQ